MSVTFNLYKVNNDVEYTGDIFDFIKPSDWASGAADDILKKHGEPEYLEGKDEEAFQKYIEDYNNWQNKIESSAWSDGNKHEMIDITHLKQVNGECRGFNRLCRKLRHCHIRSLTMDLILNYTFQLIVCTMHRGGF